jgi:hypothetical protein
MSFGRSRAWCLLLAALPPLAATAAELPEFRHGLWEYERTVGGNRFGAKECGDPAQTMRANNAALEKLGCRFSPVVRDGSTYTFTSECAIKLPSGVYSSSTRSVLTAESDSAYRLEIRDTRQGRTSEETIVAHRVADCD